MATVQNVEGWLADIGEKMAAVVDPAFRASLTSQYLALLQQWHSIPKNRKAMMEPSFADHVQRLDEQVTAGMLQYKLEPGLGDYQQNVQLALEQAYASLQRLKALVSQQQDLRERRKWEDRLRSLANQLDRVDNELSFAPHSAAHFSRLNQMSNRVNNLLAVEMLPLELEWSRELGRTPPKFVTSRTVESGALSLQVNPKTWQQAYPPGRRVGQVRRGLADLGDEAMDTLVAYNQAVTQQWLTKSAEVQVAAEKPWGLFQNVVRHVKELQVRLKQQAQWLNTKGRLQPTKVEAWQATLDERVKVFNSLVAEVRALADQMKQVSYNQFDRPEQVVQKMLGGDLPRTHAAIALLFDPQIRRLSDETVRAERAADAFDADAGIRTRR